MATKNFIFYDTDWSSDLADDGAKDGLYIFLFVGSSLKKVVSGAGSLVNPLVIK